MLPLVFYVAFVLCSIYEKSPCNLLLPGIFYCYLVSISSFMSMNCFLLS